MGNYRPITAWDIGEAAAAAKAVPLGKWGAASIRRMSDAELERCDWYGCSRRACGCDDYLDRQEVFL